MFPTNRHKTAALAALTAVCIFFCITAYAHPGRTDSKGGHTNHSTGEYHYHHGHPAHQHTGGTCPYDFDDKTGINSGSSSGSSSSAATRPTAPATTEPDRHPVYDVFLSILPYVCLFLFTPLGAIFICVCTFLWELIRRIWCFIIGRPYMSRSDQKAMENRLAAEAEAQRKKEIADLERRKKELEEKQKFEENKAKYTALYGGKSLAEISGIPDYAAIGDDGLPYDRTGSGKWGSRYTFYVSSSRKVYHSQYYCSTATIPIHALNLSGIRPCRRCQPKRPDLSWYSKYMTAKRIKELYHIDEPTKEDDAH